MGASDDEDDGDLFGGNFDDVEMDAPPSEANEEEEPVEEEESEESEDSEEEVEEERAAEVEGEESDEEMADPEGDAGEDSEDGGDDIDEEAEGPQDEGEPSEPQSDRESLNKVHTPTSPPVRRSVSPSYARRSLFVTAPPPPSSYLIEPIVALPHPTPIHALASSLCMTRLLTGSEDGYIREYDFFAGVNGKTLLTAPQRTHCGLGEGNVKSGVFRTWWENPKVWTGPEEEKPPPSPIHCLALHSDALWGLAGAQEGHINLFTVRHDPGRTHHAFLGHGGPVSGISIQHDERGFFSASWDGKAMQWDLDTGQTVRTFESHGAQLTSIAVQPLNISNSETINNGLDGVNVIIRPDAAAGPSADGASNSPHKNSAPLPHANGQAEEATAPAAANVPDADAKSDASYDPLFDEPDADGEDDTGGPATGQPPPPPVVSQTVLPGSSFAAAAAAAAAAPVPPAENMSSGWSTSRNVDSAAESGAARNKAPILDPAVYANYSPDVLMTACIDGQILLWDRRVSTPGKGVGRLPVGDRTPPWCVSACWSAGGTQIYAGRRNGTVEVYDVRQVRAASDGTPKLLRTLRNPGSSGQVNCVVAFPDGRHLACASIDNIRLWSLAHAVEQDSGVSSRGVMPFKIIAGHHGGVVSQILVDACSRFMITASGNRGWFGAQESTKTVLVHDMKAV